MGGGERNNKNKKKIAKIFEINYVILAGLLKHLILDCPHSKRTNKHT